MVGAAGAANPCPDDAAIEQVLAQTATPDVVAHVESCASCTARLDALRAEAALVAELRRVVAADAVAARAPDPEVPPAIAGYRVLGMLGEGGMGVVYAAEQAHPRRRVALKVLRRGMASRRAMRRLEHEAQILGRLRHPHIARVLAAGTFADGAAERPFFAMELIEGPTLLDHAAELDQRAVLVLVRDVCLGVHHAHQNGVIHRDLKPSNVLVDPLEGVKVLDFGVARCADEQARSDTLRTFAGQLIGTIAYMAPEQFDADGEAVDVRADVWALGVIAYQLLAGRLPHEPGQAVVTDVVRRITQEEPTRLGALVPACRGDVETIVHRALERDQQRRYQSALEVAQDIDRHLADQPILARPPSTLYQVRKLARRHRVLAASIVAVLLALVAGLSTTTWQWYQAQAAQRAAQREAHKSKRVSMFLAQLIDPAEGFAGEGTTVRAALERAAADLAAQEHEPLVEAELSFVVGNALRSLGDFERADALHARCLELQRAALPAGHEEIGEALNALANTRQRRGADAEATALYRESLELFRAAFGPDHPKVGRALYQLGTQAMHDPARLAQAEQWLEEAARCFRVVVGAGDPVPVRARDTAGWLANALGCLATLANRRGDRERSLQLNGEALAVYARVGKAEHPYAAIVEGNYASLLASRSEFAAAERHFVHAVTALRRAVGDEHAWTKPVLDEAVRFFEKRGQPERAAALRQPLADIERAR